MEQSYRFFENTKCEYYPCHGGIKEMNCLFCYCPLYTKDKCPGKPSYIETERGSLKVCSDCTFPHQPENYEKIIRLLK